MDRIGTSQDDAFLSSDSKLKINLPEQIAMPRFRQPDAEWLIWVWQAARLQARQSKAGYILVLDEIQKIPDWSRIVKGLWMMTGSKVDNST